MTASLLKSSIEEVLSTPSYGETAVTLGELLKDDIQTPLERAVFWTEYVLRHGGAKHMESPGKQKI